MPENENALATMLSEVDELGKVGFGVGERGFPHMTNMTNLLPSVQFAPIVCVWAIDCSFRCATPWDSPTSPRSAIPT